MSGMRDMSGGPDGSGMKNRDWTPERIGANSELHAHRSQKWTDTSQSTIASDGDPVASWEDIAGNGNDAEQSTSSNRPTLDRSSQYGRDAISPDGSDDFFIIATDIRPTTTPDISIYCVVIEAKASESGVWGNDNGSFDRFLGIDNDQVLTSDGNDFVSMRKLNFGDRTLLTVLEQNKVADSGEAFSDRARDVQFSPNHDETDATTKTSLLDIKGQNSPIWSYTQPIMHFVLFKRKNTDAERRAMEDYMMREWGLN